MRTKPRRKRFRAREVVSATRENAPRRRLSIALGSREPFRRAHVVQLSEASRARCYDWFMRKVTIPSSEARLPALSIGVATVVNRYDEESAVLLHPRDFYRLEEVDSLMNEVVPHPKKLSEVEKSAYFDLETPGNAITDPAILSELFPD